MTGRAETIKSGGRVVKNVTGYDLCKVLAGSWGTLAAMTDVTIKVLPKAETEATVIVEGLDDARACAAMAAAMGSSCDVSGAAHLPDHVASYFDGLPKPQAATALRLEGFAPSVKHRKEALAALMKPFGPVDAARRKEFARAVAERAAGASRSPPMRRVSAAALAHFDRARTRPRDRGGDHAGGADVLRLGRRADLGGDAVRGRARRRLDPRARSRASAATPRWFARPPRCAPRSTCSSRRMPRLRALNKRVKESFDPKGVLNPGRMWAGV